MVGRATAATRRVSAALVIHPERPSGEPSAAHFLISDSKVDNKGLLSYCFHHRPSIRGHPHKPVWCLWGGSEAQHGPRFGCPKMRLAVPGPTRDGMVWVACVCCDVMNTHVPKSSVSAAHEELANGQHLSLAVQQRHWLTASSQPAKKKASCQLLAQAHVSPPPWQPRLLAQSSSCCTLRRRGRVAYVWPVEIRYLLSTAATAAYACKHAQGQAREIQRRPQEVATSQTTCSLHRRHTMSLKYYKTYPAVLTGSLVSHFCDYIFKPPVHNCWQPIGEGGRRCSCSCCCCCC